MITNPENAGIPARQNAFSVVSTWSRWADSNRWPAAYKVISCLALCGEDR